MVLFSGRVAGRRVGRLAQPATVHLARHLSPLLQRQVGGGAAPQRHGVPAAVGSTECRPQARRLGSHRALRRPRAGTVSSSPLLLRRPQGSAPGTSHEDHLAGQVRRHRLLCGGPPKQPLGQLHAGQRRPTGQLPLAADAAAGWSRQHLGGQVFFFGWPRPSRPTEQTASTTP